MHGSGNAADTGVQASGASSVAPPAPPATEASPPASGQTADEGRCVVCGKAASPGAGCEVRARIEFLCRRLNGRLPDELYGPEAVVCKECCIRAGGHRCQWWDLCWNI